MIKRTLSKIARSVLPKRARSKVNAGIQTARRKLDPVVWDNLRTTIPVCRDFGFERGTPVDRHYIESFLDSQSSDIQGRVLEVANSRYTTRFGGDRVNHSDVLHAVEGNPEATIIGDLCSGEGIPRGTYDCFIMTETLTSIFDVGSAIQTAHRVLKPEGILLATVCGVSQISRFDMDQWGDYWRFSSRALSTLFDAHFEGEYTITSYGNVLSAVSLLHGVVIEDLTSEELDYHDSDFEVTVAIRAQRGKAT